MASVLISEWSRSGSSPGWGHCVVFLGKTLYSHIVSLHPGVEMGTSEFNAGVTLQWTSIPSRGGVEILLVASCYGKWDKLRPDEPLGSYANITIKSTLL